MRYLLVPLLILPLLSCQSHYSATAPGRAATFYTTPCNQRHIVFILDHSGSILDTFDFLQEDTIRTLNSLHDSQSFNIIMFSEDFTPLFSTLQPATPQNKRVAAAKLKTLRAQGINCRDVTPVQKSFQVALAQHADAIFFVTDGFDADPANLPTLIKTANKRFQTPIHTFLYIVNDDDTEKLLRQIAIENGGTFKKVSELDVGK